MSLTVITTQANGTIIATAIDQPHQSIHAQAGDQFHLIDEHGVVLTDFTAARGGDTLTLSDLPDFSALELCGFYGDEGEPCTLQMIDGQTTSPLSDAAIMIVAQNGAVATETVADASAATASSSGGGAAAAAGSGISTGAMVVGGVLGVGGIAAASSSPSPTPTPSPSPTPTPTPSAPGAPTGLDVEGDDTVVDATEAADGVVFSGSAEAGATVNLTWGSATGSATAAANGAFSITIATNDVPANGTYDAVVTASNAVGNGPAATLADVQALTRAPAAPNGLDVEGDNTVVDATEAADGVVFSGSAEAGATINLTWDSATGSATAAANGAFSITIATNDVPANGTYDAVVTASNAVGNGPAATLADVQALTRAPAAPTGLDVEGDNTVVDATEAADGVVFSGSAEAGATVNLTWGSAAGSATAAANGTFSITIATNDVPANGTYDALVTASNAVGNGPAATLADVQALTRAPAAPTGLDVEGDDTVVDATEAADGIEITGSAEVGSTVIATWGGFTSAATAVNGTTGAYTISAPVGELPLDGASSISVIASNILGSSAAQTLDVSVERGAGGGGTGVALANSNYVNVGGNSTYLIGGVDSVTINHDGALVRNGDFDFWDISSAAGASVLDTQSFGGLQFVTLQGANGGTDNPDIGWSFNSGRALPTTTATIGAVGQNQYDTSQPNIDPGFGEIELVRDPSTGNTSWETVTSTLSGGGGLTQTLLTDFGAQFDLTIEFALPDGQTHQTAGTSLQITWDGNAIAFFDATANGGAGDWIVDAPNGLSAPTSSTATSWSFDGLSARTMIDHHNAGNPSPDPTTQLGINAYENYAGTGAAVTNDGIGLRIDAVRITPQQLSGNGLIQTSGSGNDLMYAGDGNNTFTTGDDTDTVVFSMATDNGTNTITDFSVGEDRILLIDARDTVLSGSGFVGDGSEAGEITRSYLNLSIDDFLGGAGNQEVLVGDNGGELMLSFTNAADTDIGSVTLTGVSAASYIGADNTTSLGNLRNAGILDWTNDGFHSGLI